MKKTILAVTVLAMAGMSVLKAQAGVYLSVNIGRPAGLVAYANPAPEYCPPPAPVYCPPPAPAYCPPPAPAYCPPSREYYAPPQYYRPAVVVVPRPFFFFPHFGGGHRDWTRDRHDDDRGRAYHHGR